MTPPPRRSDFDAVTFDVYGTILDWEPEVGAFLADWLTGRGLAPARQEILETYDRLRQPLQLERPALPYPEILARTFDAVAAEYGQEPDAEARASFAGLAAGHRPWPDSVAALAALKASGLRLGALSNIDEASFAAATGAAGLSFDVVVTAERVGAYKPDLAHFRQALADLAALGIERQRVLHVAQSLRADIVPANALGLASVWVDRPDHVFGRRGAGAETARPDYRVESLAELAGVLA